jgi:hypothetical protein
MRRPIILLVLPSILWMTTACAQSIHQVERASASPRMDGHADGSYGSYWGGSGYWWNPFKFYGSGYGWSGGHSSGGHRDQSHRQASPPLQRPTPPPNAPPQFKK